MERDKRLILMILRYVRENASGADPLPVPDLDGYEHALVNYHVGLCSEAKFLRASTAGTDGLARYAIWNLTWQGQEYLDQHPEAAED